MITKFMCFHKGINMGDGWETKRRRVPGYDWCIIQLAEPGVLRRLLVDTNWFKGNFPDACSVEGTVLGENQSVNDARWVEVLPRTTLGPHKEHIFVNLKATGVFTHLRLNMFPDGGISRFRVFAVRAPSATPSRL